MAVLVGYATRHRPTEVTAMWRAERLRHQGVRAEARPVTAAGDLRRWDAFVIGSAAYDGCGWEEATTFLRRNRAVLADRPTWLFSGAPPGMGGYASFAPPAGLRAMIRPRGHRLLGGSLDRPRLGLAERLVARSVRGPECDICDWDAIDSWADEIAGVLLTAVAEPARRAP